MSDYLKSMDVFFNQMRNATGTLASGSISFYSPGTEILKTVYLDRNGDEDAANPYTLSADGTAALFGDGLYDIVIKNSNGVTIYSYYGVDFTDVGSGISADKAVITLVGIDGSIDLKNYRSIGDVTVIKTFITTGLVTVADSDTIKIMGQDNYIIYLPNESARFIFPTSATEWYVV